jgi:hypothetical protein
MATLHRLGRAMHRWGNDIKMDHSKRALCCSRPGCLCVYLTYLTTLSVAAYIELNEWDWSISGITVVVGGGGEVLVQTAVKVPLCLPQISHELTWDRSCAPAVISRRLTASSMARSAPFCDNSNAAYNFMARLADISLSRGPLLKDHLN